MKTRTLFVVPLAVELLTSAFAVEPPRDPSDFKLKKIAVEAFFNRINPRLLIAQEPMPDQTLVRLAFDVPNFAKEGDTVWEFRFYAADKVLRGIIWVHPGTYAVKYGIGGWKDAQP